MKRINNQQYNNESHIYILISVFEDSFLSVIFLFVYIFLLGCASHDDAVSQTTTTVDDDFDDFCTYLPCTKRWIVAINVKWIDGAKAMKKEIIAV